MKKILIYTGVFIGLLVILWIIGNATKTFTRYRSSSRANEPTIREGSGFFASSLKEPKRFDFICVKTENKEMGKILVTFRLVGLAGDVIEIRNGDLFVNNKFVDSLFSLSHSYAVTGDDIQDHDFEKLDPFHRFINGDSVLLNISDDYVKKNIPNATRLNLPRSEKNEHIAKLYGHDWNADHFGPVTVPADRYFILGDNRHEAMDSRYLGFIPKENYVATILWKN